MAQTPNHGYNVPSKGTSNWHKPLNANFRQYDTDIEVRDVAANRGGYTPKQGAKFFATDTGKIYLGDGSSWQPLAPTGTNPTFDRMTATQVIVDSVLASNGPIHIVEPEDSENEFRFITDRNGTGITRVVHRYLDLFDRYEIELLEETGDTVKKYTAFSASRDGSRRVTLGPKEAIAVTGTREDEAPNILCGYEDNSLAPEIVGATVSGGGNDRHAHTVESDYGTIGGGRNNTVTGQYGTASGGFWNRALAERATVSGGGANTASGPRATIGGGFGNKATGSHSTVPGGVNCDAVGNTSFAAGTQCRAANDRTFVWNDHGLYHDIDPDPDGTFLGLSSAKDVAGSGVTGEDTFHVSAQGGFRFITGSDDNPRVTYISGGSAGWSTTSTRAAKTNVEPVDPREVLAGVEEMPVSTWEYADDDGSGRGERHIGPMAEDFHEAVAVGNSDAHINSINADGVALAAIKGLAERTADLEADLADREATIDEQADRIDDLAAENEALRERLDAVEDRLDGLATGEPGARPTDD